MENAMSYF